MDLKKMFATMLRSPLVHATVFCFSTFLLSNTASSAQTTTRFWSDNSGTFSTQAELLKINAASVVLKKTNQVVIEVPFSRLSQADLDFVKREIYLHNGGTPEPPQEIALNRSPEPNLSSRKNKVPIGQALPGTANIKQPSPDSNLASKAVPKERPLRYAANPTDFAPRPSEPSALSGTQALPEPLMPDAIPAVIPSKDNVTSPSSDLGKLARLKPTLKAQNEFSLGPVKPKKPPIILKSPERASEPTEKTARKSLGKIETQFEKSLAKRTSYEPIASPNELRTPETSSVSINNRLRPRGVTLGPELNSKAQKLNAGKEAEPLSNQFDQSDFFPPESADIPRILDNNELDKDEQGGDFAKPDFVEPENMAPNILAAKSKAPLNNSQGIPSSEPPSGEIPQATVSDAVVSFEENPNEVDQAFHPPAALQVASFETSVQHEISEESLAELPVQLRGTVEQIMRTNDPAQVRSAVSELQSNWPSRRYSAIVDIVQQCSRAREAATRILAIETLALKDLEQSLASILGGLEDRSFDVQEATHKILEGLKTPKLIPLLVERLNSNSKQRERIALTLAKLGPAVEPHVVSLASHDSAEMQLIACSLLGKVGTQKSIKALQSVVANSKQTRVRLQASNAIDRISSRQIQPLD